MKTAKRGLAALTCMLLLAVFALPLHVFAISGSMYNGQYFEMTYSASGFEVTKEDPPEKNNHDRIHRYYGTCRNGTISISGTFTIIGEWCPKPTIHFSGSAYGYGTNIMDFHEMCPTEYVAVDDSTGSYSFEVPVTSEYKQVVIELSASTSDRSDPPETVFGNWPSGHVHLQLENLDFTGEADTGGGVYPQNNYDSYEDEGGYEDYEDYEEPVIEDGDIVIDPGDTYVDASENAGEEQGVSIPTLIGSAVAGGAILIGGKLVLKKKKNKKSRRPKKEKRPKNPPPRPRAPEPAPEHRPEPESTPEPEQKQEPEQEQEEEQKPQSTYQMRVHKDFGDTITPGERLPIFARMVEITPDGQEKLAPDLTRKIRIYAKNYLRVDNEMMAGEYKAAYVTAPQTDKFPETAEVIFEFAGIYKVHMKFKIGRMEILFGQENLTLPACYDGETRLPFVVSGASDKTIVEVEVKPADYYAVQLECTENPQNYFVTIKEICKEKNEPGRCEQCSLHVTAGDAVQITAEEFLPMYRMHMGLQVLVGGINCYLTKDEEGSRKQQYEWNRELKYQQEQLAADAKAAGIELPDDLPGAPPPPDLMKPAITQGSMIIFDWDEESHQVLRIAPIPTAYSFKSDDPKNQDLLDKLGINCNVLPDPIDGRRAFEFQCGKAVLDPPTRFKAQVTITAEYNGKTYTWTDEKLVRSQKIRGGGSMEGDMALLQADRHITERLIHIKQKIWDDGYYSNLFPLVHFIDLVMDGYDSAYGYDPGQIAKISDIWKRFLDGSFAGANGTPETVTLADEVSLYLNVFMDTAKEVEDSMGFLPRMILGVCTLGMSDAVFTGLSVVREMKAYVDNGGDSTWGAFCVGAKIVTFEYISEKVMDAGMKIGGAAARKTMPNLAKKVDNALDSAARTMDKGVEKVKSFFTSKKGARSKLVIDESRAFKKQLDYDADKLIREERKKMKWTEAELEQDRIFHQGGVDATQKLNELQAAHDLVKANPTLANKKLYKQKMLEVQQSKPAMRRLGEMPNGKKYRAEYFKQLDEAYQNTNRKVRQDLADALNKKHGTKLTADDIEVFNATSSSKADLLAGKRVTYDQDITWQVKGHSDIQIEQGMAQKIQNRRWYEECNGKMPPDDAIAERFAKKTDQSVVQAASPENYGSIDDLNRVLKDHNLPLLNPDRVGKTVTFKSTEWFNRCDDLMKVAQLEPDQILRERLMADAMYYRQEGVRQMVKQFKYVDARNLAAMCRGADSQLSKQMHLSIKLCSKMFETGPTCISLTTLEKMLAKNGLSLEMLAKATGDAMRNIG